MPSLVDETLFSDPSGPGVALVHFGSAVAFTLILARSWFRGAPFTNYWLVFMVAGTALAGVAEALPSDWNRTAGFFRLAGIFTLASLLCLLVFTPELLL
ncbi:hypothetical protein [Salinirubrum litoreum]|uniref:Uncharacterized protein n=1 Tax=Salinirubrum litoreum TaxID=1126234 RepID=A0ABD5RHE4_9EURY|nr:hypothetical protein [Salinirubrum litoreum]